MKKMIMMLAAVAMAACAQAATINWQIGEFCGPDGNPIQSGSTAYTLVVTLYADAAGQNVLETNTVTTFNSDEWHAMSYNAAKSTRYYMSAIISANDGSATASSGICSFVYPSGIVAICNLTLSTSQGFETPLTKLAVWETTTDNIPEPTSGLMLLLGLAGLALKRKVA